jgi:hypothetical protein
MLNLDFEEVACLSKYSFDSLVSYRDRTRLSTASWVWNLSERVYLAEIMDLEWAQVLPRNMIYRASCCKHYILFESSFCLNLVSAIMDPSVRKILIFRATELDTN